jgi:predicted esterase YcpF (UPF0227 family)
MKILYFPGLASIIEKDHDFAKSCKYVHLREMADCDIFDYQSFNPTKIVAKAKEYDLLFGSSFGGFFAFYISVVTGQKSISVNPSLTLDERINTLKQSHPKELSFISQNQLKILKVTPKGEKCPNVNILMNLDDEVINAYEVLDVAKKFGCNTYEFEKGGHQSHNFQGDMLPVVRQIISS